MAFKDIRKSRRWLSAEEIRLLALLIFILVAVLVGNLALARVLPGGEWFFLRWSGARAFLEAQAEAAAEGSKGGRALPEGPAEILVVQTEPYGREIAQQTQEIAYGRIALSSEYTFVLNDPFYIVLLYVPLALLQNVAALVLPSAAPYVDFIFLRGLWMLLSQIALIATISIALNLSEWQPPRWLYILIFGFGLFSYFSVNALVTGTPAVMLALLFVWILLGLRAHADEVAGVLLSLVAYQWEVGGLFFLFVLFYVLAKRRWRVLAGFGMSLFVLLAISFLTYPGWGLPYLRAVISAWQRGADLTFGSILSNWLPAVPFPVGRVIAIVLGIMLFLEWLGSLQAQFRRVVWTACLSLAVTPLMGFAIFPANQVVLLFPFVLILALAWERWQNHRVLATVLLLFLAFAIPFGLYWRSVFIYDQLVTDLLSVLPPVAAITGLYWMRWWAVRSPRTWFDQIGDQA